MARTRAGIALTKRHQTEQLAIRAEVLRAIIKLMPIWAPEDPDSYDRFVQAVVTLVQGRARDSAAIAARYYSTFKDIDLGLTMGRATQLAAAPTVQEIIAAINATAKAGYYRALRAGKTPGQATANALTELAGAAGRLVLNGGRQTIWDNVGRDPYVHGWIRVSSTGAPCAFCAMLLSRGPVYLEFETAGGISREMVGTEAAKAFQWHDHCACFAEPYVKGGPWPEQNRRYRDIWNQTKHDKTTHPLNAFRRALAEQGLGTDE